MLLTPEGQDLLRNGAFAFLAKSNYFTFLENNGKVLTVKKAIDFTASMKDRKLIYNFTIPINLPFADFNNFRAASFDKEYYTDILLLEDKIVIDAPEKVELNYAVHPAVDQKFWGFITPKAIHISVKGGVPIQVKEIQEPSIFAQAIDHTMSWVMAMQKDIKKQLSIFGVTLRHNPLDSTLWLFLGLSLIYGVIHAIGPGHGKAVVCSYFLSHPGSLASGAIMGNVLTFVHMSSAAIVVGVAYMLFSSTVGGFQEASRSLQPASYALIALMGLFLFIQALRQFFGKTETGCGCIDQTKDEPQNMRQILSVAFITGLVPCPGAAVVLSFAISQDIFWCGVGALFAMAIGMGITTTLFAWLAVSTRGATMHLTSRNQKLLTTIRSTLSIGGALVILAMGSMLFWSSYH